MRSAGYVLTIACAAALVIGSGHHASAADADQARRAVAEGKAALERNEPNSAVTFFRKAVDADKSNGEAQFELAVTLNKLGDLSEVEQRLQTAKADGFDAGEVDAALAELFVRLGKVGRVLDEIPEGNRRSDLEARVRTARGYAELNLRQMQDAERAFHEGIARAKVGLAQTRIVAGDLASAQELLDQAIAEDANFIDPWILLGRVRALRNDQVGARAAFDKAVELVPDSLLALLGRASLLIDSDEQQAAKDVAAALDQAPDNWKANLLDATIKARHQQWRDAEAALMTISAPEEIPQSLYLLARVNLALGAIGQAETNITHFLALFPGDRRAIGVQAQIMMIRGKAASAVDLLKQGLAATPNDIALLGLLSDAYTRNRQYKEAADVLDQISTLAPQDADVRVQLAQHRMAIGHLDEALQDLAIAKAAEPLSPRATSLTLQALVAAGHLDEATALAKKEGQENPQNPFGETYLGVIAVKRGDLANAREHFTKALSLEPQFGIAAVDLAQTYRVEKRNDDARAVLDRFLEQNPNNLIVLTTRAQIENEDGKKDAALSFLERARASNPQAQQPRLDLVAAYLERKEPAKAVAIARELDAIPPANPRATAALAEAELANNDKDTAIQTFQHLVEITDGAPEAQIRLAEVLTAAGDVQKGYRAMRQGLEISPTDERMRRAFLEFSLKNDMAGASADFVIDLLKRRPDDANLFLLLGQFYESNGRFERAAQAYETGFNKHPSGELVVGLARSRAHGPKPDTTFATLTAWLEKQPDDRAARFAYANLLTETKQYQPAIAECNRLLTDDPKNPVLLNNLAWLYYVTKDSHALAKAQEAYDLAPKSATIAGTLGWITVEKGDLKRGIELLRQAVDGSPSPAVRYHLAVALSRAGIRQEALQVLTDLVQSGAQFEDRAAAETLIAKLRG